uniref:Uncharacterized protein n=1 Tax=Medicago truncatula TaxID=3880 RepID=A2Q187_MEDTR|nr:hypothetical protein MtrDRAFT_AC148340g26v2 [Medicago truncatula]
MVDDVETISGVVTSKTKHFFVRLEKSHHPQFGPVPASKHITRFTITRLSFALEFHKLKKGVVVRN